MDSFNYANLLGAGGVWTIFDNDGSGVTVSYELSSLRSFRRPFNSQHAWYGVVRNNSTA